ncbi:MAG: alpha/beta hydrolase [Lachnospiraceae bacterium]|nr:alpha/beta hydrolase [Lachnospiraceae bacterium]
MGVRKEESSFRSRDGKTQLRSVSWIPESKPRAVLQIIHGMNEYLDRYDRFACFLAEKGFYVTGEDHLGHGKSVPEGGIYGYFSDGDSATVLVRDVHRLKKITQERTGDRDEVPYFMLGHSLGSLILRNYLPFYGKDLDGALILGTTTLSQPAITADAVLLKSMIAVRGGRHVSKKAAAFAFGKYLSRIDHPRTFYDWISKDEAEVERFIKDPLCSGFTITLGGLETMVELCRRMQLKGVLSRMPQKLPVLIAAGAQDPVGEYGADPLTLYDTYLNLDMTKVTVKIYPGMRHEILNETDREKVYADIYNWLSSLVNR